MHQRGDTKRQFFNRLSNSFNHNNQVPSICRRTLFVMNVNDVLIEGYFYRTSNSWRDCSGFLWTCSHVLLQLWAVFYILKSIWNRKRKIKKSYAEKPKEINGKPVNPQMNVSQKKKKKRTLFFSNQMRVAVASQHAGPKSMKYYDASGTKFPAKMQFYMVYNWF